VAFSPDGKWCATGGEDHAICLWETATGRLRYRFPPAHRDRVTSLQFAGPARLVSAAADNTLRFWQVEADGARLESIRLDRRSGDVPVLGVSHNGTRVLFDRDRELRVLSLPEGWTEGTLRRISGMGRFTTLAVFSPDSRLILTATEPEGHLELWSAPTATIRPYEMRKLVWKGLPCSCGAFSPDGSFLVAGMKDRQVRSWSLPSRQEVTRRLEAEITLVEPSVDPKSHLLRLWAEIDNRDGSLIPGATATLVAYPR
jgi:WD40 repeat protein